MTSRVPGGVSALRLYRSILKEHQKKLPPMFRELGDNYVREEFKRHMTAKAQFLTQFFGNRPCFSHTMACSDADAHNYMIA
jgi:hypothetical protein